MTLSNLLNNAATTIIAAPVAIGMAEALRARPRPVPDGGGGRRLLRLPHPDRDTRNNTAHSRTRGATASAGLTGGWACRSRCSSIAVSVPAILVFWPL